MTYFGRALLARGITPLAGLLFLIVAATTAHAQSPANQSSLETRINVLMRQGQFADAYELASQGWGPETPHRQARLDFIQAMSLKAQGRYPETIQILRRIIAENPSFSRVRAELAHTLFLAGDFDAARFHFSDLKRNVTSDGMRESFDNYLAAIRRKRPYRLSGYISLAPSTNINNRTTARTIELNGLPFTLDEDSRARSGIGLSGGLSGDRNFYFSPDLTLTLSGRFDGTKYKEKEFDRFQIDTSAYLRRRVDKHTFGVGIIGDYYNTGHHTYREGIGAGIEYGRVFGGGRHLFTSLRVMAQRYPDAPILNGYQVSANIVGRQALGPGQYLTAGLRFTAERTEAEHYDYDSGGVFLTHSREWKGGLITQIQPSVSLRQYHAEDPTFAIRRRDVEVGGTVRLMHRKLNFKGFAPRLEYSYLRRFSNHPLQERESHDVNILMTREF